MRRTDSVLPCRHVASAACARVTNYDEDILNFCSLTLKGCQDWSELYERPAYQFVYRCKLME